jgi:hypothetical protein
MVVKVQLQALDQVVLVLIPRGSAVMRAVIAMVGCAAGESLLVHAAMLAVWWRWQPGCDDGIDDGSISAKRWQRP